MARIGGGSYVNASHEDAQGISHTDLGDDMPVNSAREEDLPGTVMPRPFYYEVKWNVGLTRRWSSDERLFPRGLGP